MSLKRKNNNNNLLKAISFLRLDLTYDELGEKLGYKKATVSKYITGKLPPSGDFLNKFEEVFKVKLIDFETSAPEIKTPKINIGGFANEYYEKLMAQKDAFLENVLKENERLRKDLDFERSKNNKI